MYKLLSSYSDSELDFLLDATTEFIDQTRKESKNYGVCKDNPLVSCLEKIAYANGAERKK